MRHALVLASLVALLSPAAVGLPTAHIWKAHCKSCHGLDGKAKTLMGHKKHVPDMTTAKFIDDPKHTDQWMADAIKNGVPNTKMKAFGDRLDGPQIDALVAYVRALQHK